LGGALDPLKGVDAGVTRGGKKRVAGPAKGAKVGEAKGKGSSG